MKLSYYLKSINLPEGFHCEFGVSQTVQLFPVIKKTTKNTSAEDNQEGSVYAENVYLELGQFNNSV